MSIKDKILASLLFGLLTVGFLYVSTDEYNSYFEACGEENIQAIADTMATETEETETETTETEQKYIVRFGVAYDFGTVIVTEDGNEWCIQDPPELAYGQKVRVLFDSRETTTETDDIIIDIIEVE